MKVLFKRYYFERELFVIEVDGKVLLVYRASGLNSGRKGRVIPFMMLNTMKTMSSPPIGYIFKEMFYDNKYINHDKSFDYYPNIKDFLLKVEDFLEKNHIVEVIEEDIKYIKKIATKINHTIEDIIRKHKMLDLKDV